MSEYCIVVLDVSTFFLCLCQGDVGCGKTVVAFLACMEVLGSGYQVCYSNYSFFLSLFYILLLQASTFAYSNLNELGPSVLDLQLYM